MADLRSVLSRNWKAVHHLWQGKMQKEYMLWWTPQIMAKTPVLAGASRNKTGSDVNLVAR
jgi:hypothetical protein